MVEGLREKATSFIKMFGTELALEFYHDSIADAMRDFCKYLTPQSLTQLIKNSEMPNIPSSFFQTMGEYRQLLEDYDAEALTKILFGLISEVRPDLSTTLNSFGDNGAVWLYRCIQVVRDKITNPTRYKEETEKSQLSQVTCDACGKSFKIFKEDADEIKQCPFCGAEGKKEEPPVS